MFFCVFNFSIYLRNSVPKGRPETTKNHQKISHEIHLFSGGALEIVLERFGSRNGMKIMETGATSMTESKNSDFTKNATPPYEILVFQVWRYLKMHTKSLDICQKNEQAIEVQIRIDFCDF